MAEHSFPETTVSDEHPLNVVTAPIEYEFKAIVYADPAAYIAGLPTEIAAGWEPIATTNMAVAVGEDLVVTYRRRVVA